MECLVKSEEGPYFKSGFSDLHLRTFSCPQIFLLKIRIMQAIAEITKYPLDQNYDGPILDFIRRLRMHDNLDITVGDTSTVVRGEFDELINAIKVEMKESFKSPGRCAFVLKILNTDTEEKTLVVAEERGEVSSIH